MTSPSKRPCYNNLPPQQPWVHLPHLTLSLVDKADLAEGKLLNDNHINPAQILLKHQFPHVNGLLDTLIVSNKMATDSPGTLNSASNITQIHNLPGHWLVSQSHGQSAIVYDSLHPGMTSPLSQQLVYMYKTCQSLSVASQTQVLPEANRICGLLAYLP